MKPIAHTERLILRRVTLADADFILELVNTPGWLAFIGDRNVHSLEDAENYLKNGVLKSYTEFGFGSYCLELKSSGKRIGMCGLYKRDFFPYFDLGFALLPQSEGNGYAKEACAAIINQAKNKLNLPALLAITSKENERSMTLLKKLDFHQQDDVEFPDSGEVLNCFRLNLTETTVR